MELTADIIDEYRNTGAVSYTHLDMRLFFSKHELKLRRKRTIAAIICAVVVLGVCLLYTSTKVSDLENIVVAPGPVLLKDVATVFFDLKDETTYSRVNGKEAVSVV